MFVLFNPYIIGSSPMGKHFLIGIFSTVRLEEEVKALIGNDYKCHDFCETLELSERLQSIQRGVEVFIIDKEEDYNLLRLTLANQYCAFVDSITPYISRDLFKHSGTEVLEGIVIPGNVEFSRGATINLPKNTTITGDLIFHEGDIAINSFPKDIIVKGNIIIHCYPTNPSNPFSQPKTHYWTEAHPSLADKFIFKV